VPASARVLARSGETWSEVARSLAVAKDAWNTAEFAPASAEAVRVEVQLQPGFSAGVLEWQVE
jgi:hypothetical protein